MSIEVMARVWRYSQHRANALLLLLAIANYANERGIAWPSQRTLGLYARTSRRQTQRLIGLLVASGELRVIKRAGAVRTSGGVQKTDMYQVLLREPKGGVTMTPPDLEGASKRTGGGVAPDRGSATAMTPDSSLDPSVRTVKNKRPRTRAIRITTNGQGKIGPTWQELERAMRDRGQSEEFIARCRADFEGARVAPAEPTAERGAGEGV